MDSQDWKQRTGLLLGEESVEKLSSRSVMVVGIGGVGAFAAEMLARAGVGHLTLVDGDVVSVTNLNRQLPALHSTLGMQKVEVMRQRILDINPDADVNVVSKFIDIDAVPELLAPGFDFVVDAIDAVAPKVALIERCVHSGTKIVSSMGAGGRKDPTVVQIVDISKTYHDGLARAVRQRLRFKGISSGVKVVWSPEQPSKSACQLTDELPNKRSSYGTVSYMPCVFGCVLASHVIMHLSK